MKKNFKAFAILAAVSALFACNKIDEQIPETNNEPGFVQFSAGPVTKTVFGTPSGSSLPTLWTDTYEVALSLNLAPTKKSTKPVVSGGGASASFSAEIDDDTSGDYNFYAVSPYDAVFSVSDSYKSFGITFPTAQTPDATTPDEAAQVLYAKEAAGSTFPTSVALTFSHLSAYGKIGELKNLALESGETIQSVSLTAPDNWVGRYYYYAEDNSTNNAGDFSESSASKTITITTSSTTDIWFGCAPVDLGGKTINVVITTDQGTYSKPITIPSGKKFESGKVAQFNINMAGITRDALEDYTLVQDVADLTVGSEVIIVAKDYNFAMSTTQNSNNRGKAGVTKSGNTISSPGSDVQVFTIENGNKAGTYAFSTGSEYIYAASSGSNHLRSESTLSNNSSWYISIANDGEATVKAVGDNTRNVLQYNNGSSIFSCYGSASQGAVTIYKKDGTGGSAITPKVAESITITGATTAYSVGDTYSFDGTVKAQFSDTSEETLTASEYTVDDSNVDMSTAGTYTVTIIYNDDTSVTETYVITVSGGGSGGSGGTLSLDFESASDSYTDWTITNIVTQQTSANVSGRTGSYYGDTDGKTSGIIVTKSKISSPGTITFYISKESTNTNADSKWYVEVSSDGSNWTQAGDDQAAAVGITRGTWTEVSRDLSSHSNVYVRVRYNGTTAVRCIDDLTLTYN